MSNVIQFPTSRIKPTSAQPESKSAEVILLDAAPEESLTPLQRQKFRSSIGGFVKMILELSEDKAFLNSISSSDFEMEEDYHLAMKMFEDE